MAALRVVVPHYLLQLWQYCLLFDSSSVRFYTQASLRLYQLFRGILQLRGLSSDEVSGNDSKDVDLFLSKYPFLPRPNVEFEHLCFFTTVVFFAFKQTKCVGLKHTPYKESIAREISVPAVSLFEVIRTIFIKFVQNRKLDTRNEN